LRKPLRPLRLNFWPSNTLAVSYSANIFSQSREAAKKNLSQIPQIPQIYAHFARIGKYSTELHCGFTELHGESILEDG
jgi:hypothetical protein